MPDWLAHLMLGWTLAIVAGIRGHRRIIFLVGNVLPDLVRFLVVLGESLSLDWFNRYIAYPVNVGSHSILGVVVYSVFIGMLVILPPSSLEETTKVSRWRSWLDHPAFLLFLGGITHLVLDTFMWPWAGGVPWLFPLMDPALTWSFQATWPGSLDAVLVLLPVSAGATLIEIASRGHGRVLVKKP